MQQNAVTFNSAVSDRRRHANDSVSAPFGSTSMASLVQTWLRPRSMASLVHTSLMASLVQTSLVQTSLDGITGSIGSIFHGVTG